MFGRKTLSFHVDIGSQVDDLANRPAEPHADNAAENSHSPGFSEEKFFHVSIAGANRLHDANLAAALKNRHHQSVHNTDGSHDQRQAAENSQECVQHSEDLLQAAAGIENRERAE